MKHKILLPSLLVLLITACSGEHEDLRQWMEQTQKDAHKHIQPFEQPTVNPAVTYIPPKTHGLNAFNSKRLNLGLTGHNAPDTKRPKEVLEAFSLENMKYVGSFTSGNQKTGYVEIDGHVYTVKAGNYVGQNFGRITGILPDKLMITEVIEDANGNWTFRNAELPLDNSKDDQSTKTNN
ncbi:MAG: pilus assembly protein PilP [Neisseria sp.]|uniref:pilus assembly protein PilP n=1 Tax=Neisseria sp. TaxID=192066 RepID=UPI0026DBF77B|nr:pilus assembly protein PilP [Neisseria sp.]MDO4640904.1 pilus assembly protein PilP [Neisseria sp.]